MIVFDEKKRTDVNRVNNIFQFLIKLSSGFECKDWKEKICYRKFQVDIINVN